MHLFGQANTEKAARGLPFLLSSLLAALLYYALLYHTPRSSTAQLFLLFGALFGVWLYQMRGLGGQDALRLGLLFRMMALFALPLLSDDYFRFFWDGLLLSHGENPFGLLPSEWMEDPARQSIGLTRALFSQLNSPEYYTVYPPVLQGIFGIAARLFPTDLRMAVLVMKLFVLAAEVGSLWLIKALLQRFEMPASRLGWYALNPLVIVELTGNLHFEALMIFALLATIWLLSHGRWGAAIWTFSLGVAAKLIPLMLLPLLYRRLGLRKLTVFSLAVGAITLLGFGLVFFAGDVVRMSFFHGWYWRLSFDHLAESIRLYYQTFEFNAGLYYLIRAIGEASLGYNPIRFVGIGLALIKIAGILLIARKEKNPSWSHLPEAIMWTLLLYFSLASIVHPWYLTTLVAMATFTRWRFAMIWSATAVLSYFSYRSAAYDENLGLVAVEYLVVLVVLLYEQGRQIEK